MTDTSLASLSLNELKAIQRARRTGALSDTAAAAGRYNWQSMARDKQLLPGGEWFTWLLLTGRGWGKTRTEAETVRQWVEQGYSRIALVAETAADARDVLVEGESGILAISPPWNRPRYEPSKRRLTWPNGAIATTYSGDDPEQLRGPQHDKALVDELAKYRYPSEVWSNLLFGLRLGDNPQVVVGTTPRPIPIVKQLLSDPTTIVTRGSLYENAANLAPTFVDKVRAQYEGTRLGRQEIGGEVLDDAPGALWKREQIDATRETQTRPLRRVVVAVDPQGSKASGTTGIVGAGVTRVLEHDHFYVLEDASLSGSPEEWGRAAVTLYYKLKADAIVVETNYGGDMVEATIRTIDANVPITKVVASRGKHLRAEPIAAIYEQGRGHHVGSFPLLEDQMCQWEPGMDSPDRLDALVWAGTELMLKESFQRAVKRKAY